jgi:hypothetical protein
MRSVVREGREREGGRGREWREREGVRERPLKTGW